VGEYHAHTVEVRGQLPDVNHLVESFSVFGCLWMRFWSDYETQKCRYIPAFLV